MVLWDRLYINIIKLLDKNNGALILKRFFKKCGKIEKWNEIEKKDVFKKIQSQRHSFIAHMNFVLVMDQDSSIKRYNDNKLYLPQIIDFLKYVQSEFEGVLSKKLPNTIYHYALGECKEEREFRDLLDMAFSAS
jgi:hypothetical protein